MPTRGAHLVSDAGPQYGFLVTHNESISIADYFTVCEDGKAVYRPPATTPIILPTMRCCRWHEMFGRGGRCRTSGMYSMRTSLSDGIDELGVLLYGHAKNAYWYGSQLARGDPHTRALSERDWPAGDLCNPRRHGVGAGESERGHRRG